MKLATLVKQKKKEASKQRSPDIFIKKFKKLPKTKEEFASNIYVRSGGKMRPFVFYDYQKKIQKSIIENPYTLVFKVRQTGLSELILLDLAGDCIGLNPIFSPEAFLGLFISWRYNIEVKSAGLRFRQIAKGIEKVYGIPLEIDNTYSFKFQDGGLVNFRSGLNCDNAIGESSGCKIVYDEARRYPLKPLLTNANATMETLGDKARNVVVSTFGVVTDDYGQVLLENNRFDLIDFVNKIREGKEKPYQEFIDLKGWNKIIVYWKAHPIYGKDDDYITNKLKTSPANESDILREHDLLIEGSAESVFPYSLVEKTFTLESYDRKEDLIDEEANYYLGIDTAGAGADYFVCVVIKQLWEKLELCFVYRNRTNPTPVHLNEIGKIIKKYKPYRVSIETNSGGQNYYDLIAQNFPSQDLKSINTNGTSKPAMVNRLLYLLEKNDLTMVNDRIVREEFLSFEKIENKYRAIEGKHDDCVMATAIACYGIPLLNS